MSKYVFVNEGDDKKLNPNQIYETIPERYSRPFQRSQSDDIYDTDLSIQQLENFLSYIISNLFLYKTAKIELINFMYDRLRQLKVNLKKSNQIIYDEIILSFLTLIFPLYITIAFDCNNQDDYKTFKTQNMMYLLDDLQTTTKIYNDCICKILNNIETSNFLQIQLNKANQEQNLDQMYNLINDYLYQPNYYDAVIVAYFVPKYYILKVLLENKNSFETFYDVQISAYQSMKECSHQDFKNLFKQDFIVQSLLTNPQFHSILTKISTNPQVKKVTWSPQHLAIVQIKTLNTVLKEVQLNNQIIEDDFMSFITNKYQQKAICPNNEQQFKPLTTIKEIKNQMQFQPAQTANISNFPIFQNNEQKISVPTLWQKPVVAPIEQKPLFQPTYQPQPIALPQPEQPPVIQQPIIIQSDPIQEQEDWVKHQQVIRDTNKYMGQILKQYAIEALNENILLAEAKQVLQTQISSQIFSRSQQQKKPEISQSNLQQANTSIFKQQNVVYQSSEPYILQQQQKQFLLNQFQFK